MIGDTSIEEFQLNLHNRIRSFLLDYDRLKLKVDGETVHFNNETSYCFGFPAVDWDSVLISGQNTMYFRKLSKENNWNSCIEFRRPQSGPIEIKNYKRYYTLVLASVEDVPADIKYYFSSQMEGVTVPLTLPIIDMDHSAYLENGELLTFTGKGVIAIYGPADDIGYLSTESNAQRIKQAFIENSARMGYYGIKKFTLGEMDAKMFPDMCEVSIEFEYAINLNMQEDHYWKPIY